MKTASMLKNTSKTTAQDVRSTNAGLIDRSQPVLQVTDLMIRQIQRKYLPDSLVTIVLKQFFYERKLQLRKHVNFRHRQNDGAVKAYSAMDIEEFEGINARQRWANWLSVSRSLNGRLPNRPLRALDLCCGIGHSTEVLAVYLAPGSEILGLEFNPEFVNVARTREYRDETDAAARVRFRAQSVLEPFCDVDGTELAAESVDLVSSCGAVGHHFDPATTEKLAVQVARVLRKGGLATIDSGAAGTPTNEVIAIFSRHGFEVLGTDKSCFLDRSTHVCLKKI